MPPRQSLPAGRTNQQKTQSSVQTIINAALAPENRAVVTAVGMFAAGVAFLHVGFGEYLLPPSV